MRAIAVPAAFLFCGVVFREILMDINDRAGDAAAHIPTLPSVLGPSAALLLAAFTLLTATGLGIVSATSSVAVAACAAHAHVSLALVQSAASCAVCAAVAPLLVHVYRIWASRFDAAIVSAAIDASFKPIAATMVLLAAVAA